MDSVGQFSGGDAATSCYSLSDYAHFGQGEEQYSLSNLEYDGTSLTSALCAPHSAYNAYGPSTSAGASMEYVHGLYALHYPGDLQNGLAENLPYGARSIVTNDGKRKRRRIITMEQRKAANIRERRRMFHLNEAFDQLRKRVPTFAYEKKLSRIETLKLAVTYIEFMSDMLHGSQDGSHSPTSRSSNDLPFLDDSSSDGHSTVDDAAGRLAYHVQDELAESLPPVKAEQDMCGAFSADSLIVHRS